MSAACFSIGDRDLLTDLGALRRPYLIEVAALELFALLSLICVLSPAITRVSLTFCSCAHQAVQHDKTILQKSFENP